jgi:hypothetical protein
MFSACECAADVEAEDGVDKPLARIGFSVLRV